MPYVAIAQVQNCFDTLKQAWESRKGEIEARMKALGGAGLFGGGGYGGMYGNPAQQYAHLENVSFLLPLHRIFIPNEPGSFGSVAGEGSWPACRYVDHDDIIGVVRH